MNGFGLLLVVLSLALGAWLHHRQNKRDREFQEFVAEVRLAQIVAAWNTAGDDVEQQVFAQAIARGRWN